ncbi:MAG: hypothetical protein IKY07_07240 [Clostridia bacterium]|nr:hypothetical protein [Clostridia bacterium]
MLYFIIRALIGLLFMVCAIVAVKKLKKNHSAIVYISIVGISVLLTVVLAFLPFENLFVTFNSPEEAYDYYLPGKSNIELVVEGDACVFVIDHKQDYSYSCLIVPKTADGYKIGIGSKTKAVARVFSNGIFARVYQYGNTNDFFVTVLDTGGGTAVVSDDYGTEFYPLESVNDSLGKVFVTYHGHIDSFDKEYRILVNDTEIVLKSD